MKKLALLSFLLILIASTEVRFCKADALPDAVLDVDGDKLRAGDKYYIVPILQGNTGGLAVGSIQKNQCELNIVVGSYDGLPATFAPVNSKKGVVRVSTDLNIQFQADTHCGKSTVWKAGKVDKYIGEYTVTMGGRKGNPGRETVDSWFKIEKHDNNYKLVYCPTVCKNCRVMCNYVGMFYVNGKMILVLKNSPLPVAFKKV